MPLSGTLSAFVGVDVILYTKRWEVELARFDGPTQTFPLTHSVLTAQAVDPATVTTACK